MPRRSKQREQLLADILITAVEGGINYWAKIDEYRWDCLDKDVYAVIRPCDDFDIGEPALLNIDIIAKGIRRLLAPGFQVSPDVRRWVDEDNRDYGAGNIDADAADCIVQAAIFGKLVYG